MNNKLNLELNDSRKFSKLSIILSLGIFFSLVLINSIIAIPTQDELDIASKLINSQVSCSNLTNDQLEIIGEYIMEQQHPGQLHELMHQRMGLKDGSPEEQRFHINLAKMMYCRTTNSYGMMGGRGMMGGYNYNNNYNNSSQGNDQFYRGLNNPNNPNNSIIYFILGLIFVILVVIIIILAIRLSDNKTSVNMSRKK